MRTRSMIGLAALLSCGAFTMAAAAEIRVAATIAPAHSLVAMVAGDMAEPDLIVRPGASPHDYAMKPSEARALNDADVVFWVGEGLEPWMAKAVEALAGDALLITLGEVGGIERLPFRRGGIFTEEDHDHAHHDHLNGADPHLWLDPDNALIWLGAIADALAKADPPNAETYHANATAAGDHLRIVSAEIERSLAQVREKPYVVFHDGYQYFERRFGLHPLGAVSLGDANRPGPARVVAIREVIAESGAVCIFAEPQFEPRLIETVIEGTDVKTGTLDPIGAGLQPGAGLYPALIRGLAQDLLGCLG